MFVQDLIETDAADIHANLASGNVAEVAASAAGGLVAAILFQLLAGPATWLMLVAGFAFRQVAARVLSRVAPGTTATTPSACFVSAIVTSGMASGFVRTVF